MEGGKIRSTSLLRVQHDSDVLLMKRKQEREIKSVLRSVQEHQEHQLPHQFGRFLQFFEEMFKPLIDKRSLQIRQDNASIHASAYSRG